MPIELAFDLQVNYLHKKNPPKSNYVILLSWYESGCDKL